MAKQPFSVIGAYSELEKRGRKTDYEIEKATKSTPKKKKPTTRKKPKGTSLKAARASKHVGSEGETAYGQRMTPRPKSPGSRKARFKAKGRYPK